MAFPNLQLDDFEAHYHAFAEGVPDDGNNVVKLPFRPGLVKEDRMVVCYIPLRSPSSVVDAHVVSVNPENNEMVINFVQQGLDPIRVEVSIEHSIGH